MKLRMIRPLNRADNLEPAVFLRQRGSPESKPVGAAHAVTGETAG